MPKHLNRLFKVKPKIEYAFGKDDDFLKKKYDIVLHCGGCMITN